MSEIDFTPIPGREQPRFAAIKTFFRLPHVDIDAGYDVALAGLPYDGALSYRPGARFAPTKVRELSSMGRGYHMTREINFVEKLKCADIGDCPTVPIDMAQTGERVEKFFGDILARDKKFIVVGGDHSNTLPLLRAVAKKYGPVNFIHFDAHLDTYPAAWGCEYHHGAFLRHALEEGLVKPQNTWQFGIRGPLAANDDLGVVEKFGVNVTTVDDVRINGLEAFIDRLPKFEGPTYMSFDIDALDPAYAPGTGTPVPGGLTTYEAQRILRAFEIDNLVAADIMEVSPPYDPTEITALAAVDVMFEQLCLMASNVK